MVGGFFFFQERAAIRYPRVAGIQPCALPIWGHKSRLAPYLQNSRKKKKSRARGGGATRKGERRAVR